MAERRTWLIGLVLAFVMGLIAGWGPWTDRELQAKYATNPDILDILDSLEGATAGDVVGWWHGQWCQRGSPYYRPLSSMVMWAEHCAFGDNGYAWAGVSWVANGAVFAALFALAWRVFPQSRLRVLAALAPCALFAAALAPEGPGWHRERTVPWLIIYWPAQTDFFSLLFALASLICLDAHLNRAITTTQADADEGAPRRSVRLLIAACALGLAAMLFKETAVVLAAMAPALALMRSGWRAALRVLGIFGAMAALFVLMRRACVPGAWGPEVQGVEQMAYKFIWYHNERVTTYLKAGDWWVLPAAATNAAAVWALVRTRLGAIWIVLGAVLLCAAWEQIFAGNFALVTVPRDAIALGSATSSAIGLMALLLLRSRLLALLAVWGAVATLPALHVMGPHYFYWPHCWWALFGGGVALTLVLAARSRRGPGPNGGRG